MAISNWMRRRRNRRLVCQDVKGLTEQQIRNQAAYKRWWISSMETIMETGITDRNPRYLVNPDAYYRLLAELYPKE